MAQFYLIRHGQADYSLCDERGYIGHGRDLAPLSEKGIKQALNYVILHHFQTLSTQIKQSIENWTITPYSH